MPHSEEALHGCIPASLSSCVCVSPTLLDLDSQSISSTVGLCLVLDLGSDTLGQCFRSVAFHATTSATISATISVTSHTTIFATLSPSGFARYGSCQSSPLSMSNYTFVRARRTMRDSSAKMCQKAEQHFLFSVR